jgi:NAD(P)-dependent dehydrogenase (short-subunit alcohol dehydrogenase family)
MKLEGKVVAITGASSGIGRELALQMARKGAKVALGARNAIALKEVTEKIKSAGGSAMWVPVDVSRKMQVENFIRLTVAEYGRLDALVSNAGVAVAKGTLLENTEADIRATMETNFMSAIYGTWAAAPELQKVRGGLLVFVSSIVGKRGVPTSSAYCASKFALQGLTESIRPELARKDIRVITICPPGVDTPFFANNGRETRRTFRLHPVEKIAAMIVRACEKETREALLTLDAKLLHWGNFFVPGLLDRLIAKNKGI